MCEPLSDDSSSPSTVSEKNNLRGDFTILEVEVDKSALNFPVSTEESSSSSTGIGEIEIKICQDVADLSLEKDENEERDHWVCKDSLGTPRPGKSEVSFEPEAGLEYTLAMIMPEALIYRKEIEHLMVEEGFNVCQTRWLQLTPEQVSDFYFDNYEQEDFARLVSYMSSGPILVYVISKTNCIEDWNQLIGPENIGDARIYAPDSIRGRLGTTENEMRKVVHGSADKSSAEKEIKFFFPDRKIEPAITEETAIQYLWNKINEALVEGLIKCCEEKPRDPIVWLGNWLLDNKTDGPKYLLRYYSNLKK